MNSYQYDDGYIDYQAQCEAEGAAEAQAHEEQMEEIYKNYIPVVGDCLPTDANTVIARVHEHTDHYDLETFLKDTGERGTFRIPKKIIL